MRRLLWLETTAPIPDGLSGISHAQVLAYNSTDDLVCVGGEHGDCVIAVDRATVTEVARIPAGDDIRSPGRSSITLASNRTYCANE